MPEHPQPDARAALAGRRSRAAVALACVAACVIGWQLLDSRLPSPLAPGPAQRAEDERRASPAAAWAAPVAGTPFGPLVQPHAWVGKLVLALSPARRSPVALRVAAAALVAACVVVLVLVLRGSGCRGVVALAPPLALVCGGAFRAPDAAALGTALDAALCATGLLALMRARQGGSGRWRLAAVGAMALAAADQAAWLAVAIPWGAYLVGNLGRPSAGRDEGGAVGSHPLRLVAMLAIAMVAAGALAAVATARTFQSMPAAPGVSAAVPGLGAVLHSTLLGPLSAGPAASSPNRSTAGVILLAAGWWRMVGLLGSLLAAAGAVRLVAGRASEAWLFVGAPAAVLLLASFRAASDVSAIAAPALLGGVACLAVGAQHVFVLRGSWMRGTGTVLLSLLVVVAALRYGAREGHAAAASEEIDRSLFESAFNARAAVVAEGVDIDRVLIFAMAGAPAAGPLAPIRIPQNAVTSARFRRAGFEVLAFERGRAVLEARGQTCAGVDVRIRTLAEYLTTLPDGSLVAMAVSANANRGEEHSVADAAVLVGGGPDSDWSSGRAVAIVGVLGARRGAASATGVRSAALVVRGGERLDGTRSYLPGTVTVNAGEREASISLEGRWSVRADDGLAVAVFDAAGDLVDRQTAGAGREDSLVSHSARARLFRLR